MMKNSSVLKRIALLAGVFIVLALSPAFGQHSDREKLARLDTHLSLLADEALTGRTVGGWFMVGAGVAVGIGGVIASELWLETRNDKTIIEAASIGGGIVFVGGGILCLLLPTETETAYRDFIGLLQNSEEEIKMKIQRGEVILETLALNAQTGRMLSGLFSIGMGATELITYLVTGSDLYGIDLDFYDPSPGLIIGAAVSKCVTGFITLLFETRPEREWRSYREWNTTDGISSQLQTVGPEIALIPGLLGATVQINF